MQEFWSLELLVNVKEDKIEKRQTSTIENEWYVVKLTWKDLLLKENFIIIKKRLDSELKRLGKSHKLLKQYSVIINEQLENGIMEEVGDCLPIVRKAYMPHQAVVRNNHAITKLWVVYYAFWKMKGPPFNEA